MKPIIKSLELLTAADRRSASLLLMLTLLKGFADMVGVAIIFPFLSILGNPKLIQENDYVRWVYEAFGFETSQGFIVACGVAVILVLTSAAALRAVTAYATFQWTAMQGHRLSVRMLSTYLRGSYEDLLNRHGAELCSHALGETQRIVTSVYRPLADLISGIVTLLFVAGLLAVTEPFITAVAIVSLGGAYSILFLGLRPKLRELAKSLLVTNRNRTLHIWEALGGSKQIKLVNREAQAVSAYENASYEFARANSLSQALRAMPRYGLEAIAFSSVIILTLVLVVRGGGAGGSDISGLLPTLGLFVFAGYRLMPTLQAIYVSVASIRLSSSAVNVVVKDLEEENSLPPLDPIQPKAIGLSKEIELRDVTYRYPGAGQDSLKDVNLTIRRGQKIGVIGHTGSGKTTLVDLLLGLVRPTTGEVRIDGRVLDDELVRAWRASVGYVAQDNFLSDTSITRNIAFGCLDDEIDHSRVEAASKMAQLHEFVVNELTDGYATSVGEDGSRLSGGQRQRVGIARALYSGAEVLVFDEATSALDNDTESLVMAEIQRLATDRTIIIIAHRLSTVRDCDVIITMDRGAVKSIGGAEMIAGKEATDFIVSQPREKRSARAD